MGPEKENWHEILLKVDGVEIPVLYVTGASVTCLSRAIFEKYFTNAQRRNHYTSVKGAGNNDLGGYGVYSLPVKYKDKKEEYGQFMLGNNLDVDLIGIDLINNLGISYDAKTQQVFSTSDEPNILQVTGEHTILAFSTQVLMVRFTVQITPLTTPVATIVSPRHRHLTGGPALVSFDNKRVCKVAITNTAPYAINLGQNEFISTLHQWTDVDTPIPLDHKVMDKFIHKLETKTQQLMTDKEIEEKANLNVPEHYKAQ